MSKWISVKDRLPHSDDDNEYLIFHSFKRKDGSKTFIIFVGWWDFLNDEWVCGFSGMLPPFADDIQEVIDDFFRLKKNAVTHWMSLPNPPKENNIDEKFSN